MICSAARSGSLESVKRMLDLGWPIDAQDEQGFSALHWASWRGRVELVELLIARGAPLELENRYGGTVLDSTVWGIAQSNGDETNCEPVIRALVHAGAQLNRVTPFPSGNKRVDDILRELGK